MPAPHVYLEGARKIVTRLAVEPRRIPVVHGVR